MRSSLLASEVQNHLIRNGELGRQLTNDSLHGTWCCSLSATTPSHAFLERVTMASAWLQPSIPRVGRKSPKSPERADNITTEAPQPRPGTSDLTRLQSLASVIAEKTVFMGLIRNGLPYHHVVTYRGILERTSNDGLLACLQRH